MAVQEQRDLKSFLLDFETWVLQNRWDSRIGIPAGRHRHEDPLWRQVIQEELRDYPRKTWDQYVTFVLQGWGDEWFQADQEGIIDQGYLEAQTKQRTSYLCRDMVAPLSVSLHERIVPLALAQRRPNGTMARCSICLCHDRMCTCAVSVNGCSESAANLRRVGSAGG
jgi:hypothetical protein